MKKDASILKMYAVTPCHVGSGSSLGIVDLPIQRERHTNWPVIPSSAMKGAMRAHFDKFKTQIRNNQVDQFNNLTELIFGSESEKYAGAIVISDGKILAFPVRSNIAPFVWITCPSVLKRLYRDLKLIGKQIGTITEVSGYNALIYSGDIPEGKILLEDIEVIAKKISSEEIPNEIKTYLNDAERLIYVSDEVFDYAVTNTTTISAQIKIDQTKGTTQDGSLRYQEELPADTIMYSIIFWDSSRDEKLSLKGEVIKKYVQEQVIVSHLQVGGDETCGRGIFEITWK